MKTIKLLYKEKQKDMLINGAYDVINSHSQNTFLNQQSINMFKNLIFNYLYSKREEGLIYNFKEPKIVEIDINNICIYFPVKFDRTDWSHTDMYVDLR